MLAVMHGDAAHQQQLRPMQTALQQATLTEYTGQRSEDGQLHGEGHAVFASGQVYEGSWAHGHMHGNGSVSWPDGISYEGTMQQDAISGAGVYRWGSTAVYEGEVLGGLRHGQGTLRFVATPVMYVGGWQAGRRHGHGVLYYNAEQTAYYDGDWVGDMKHGQGTSCYPSGNSYSGGWAHDKQQGHGTMVYRDSGQTYTGQWVDGLPHGLGEHVWHQPHQQGQQQQQPQGPPCAHRGPGHAVNVMHNRYVGMFEQGQRHGEGTLFYCNGARYEGQWQCGRKHGSGVYVFEDGTVFAGPFSDDRPDMAAGCMMGAEATFAGQGCGSTSPRAAAMRGRPRSTGGSSGSGTARSSPRRASGKPAEVPGDAGSRPSSGSVAAAQQPQGKPGARSSSSSSSGGGGGGAASAKPAGREQGAAGKQAGAAGVPAAGPAAAPAPPQAAAEVPAGGVPVGFGPPQFTLQLYIGDLLQECAGAGDEAVPAATVGPSVSSTSSSATAATYRGVINLLTRHNTELRLVYDRYAAQCSPFASPGGGADPNSWAMTAGQFWELAVDAKLLCRHLQLAHVCRMLQQVTTPPPAVQQRRQRVLASAGAPAVVQQPRAPYTPDQRLLFRDFCEVLVRVAALRYPTGAAGLEAQLQRLLAHNIMPLLGGGSGSSNSRQLAGGARTSLLSASAAAMAHGSGGSSGCGGPDSSAPLLRSRLVQEWLGEHVGLLQQLYGAVVAGCAGAAAEPAGTTNAGGGSSSLWLTDAVTVRQVLSHLQACGWLEQWQLAPEAAASALLHDVLTPSEPAEARACIALDLPDDSTACGLRQFDSIRSSSGRAMDGSTASSAGPRPDLVFWMDCQLLLPEVVWGLMRLAAGRQGAHAGGGSGGGGTPSLLHAAQQMLLGQQHGLLAPFMLRVHEPAAAAAAEAGACAAADEEGADHGAGAGGADDGWDEARADGASAGGAADALDGALDGHDGALSTVYSGDMDPAVEGGGADAQPPESIGTAD